jgi:hypothetical protein
MYCANCYRSDSELLLKTSYGDWLCEDCWDDYICTEAGMLEYFIGFCREDYHPDEFDADFVGEAVRSYQINYNKLELTEEQRLELEEKAKELGIL